MVKSINFVHQTKLPVQKAVKLQRPFCKAPRTIVRKHCSQPRINQPKLQNGPIAPSFPFCPFGIVTNSISFYQIFSFTFSPHFYLTVSLSFCLSGDIGIGVILVLSILSILSFLSAFIIPLLLLLLLIKILYLCPLPFLFFQFS